MARSAERSIFLESVAKIKTAPPGREAVMYGPLRDLFVDALGYKRADVDIDTTGEGGRPDLTVRAPSGLERSGKPYLIDWIVVEAKAQAGIFADPAERERIFNTKLKYITLNTAWFVMAEPTIMVARPVQRSLNAAGGVITTYADIEFALDGTETSDEFKNRFSMLAAAYAGVPERLKRFRAGDETLIATDRLEHRAGDTLRETSVVTLNRRHFFEAVSEATSLLQSASANVLDTLAPQVEEFEKLRNDFERDFHGAHIEWKPLVIKGNPQSLEQARDHRGAVAAFRRAIQRNPVPARLALVSLPEFVNRTGSRREDVLARFATETANLILARILVVRFLEDHGFFGKHKYVCNGGVEAFQKMRSYFQKGYTRLLEDAFRSARALYAAAFDETELDWIIGMDDRDLSSAIEWSMYLFSRFDFATVRGDALTGIYDRFLDRKKRKQFGEFYTPPSVARYIVERLNLRPRRKILDPACGSGTFLIEAFEHMIAVDARRGAADASDILEALQNINGNDLNSFSAILAQIQLMWQLLPFKSQVLRHGFPELRVADGDSLKHAALDTPISLFSEIDGDSYDAVIGNPPYIRPERLRGELDAPSREFFVAGGISPDQNSYALFLYKALAGWCKQDRDGPGRVGFIVPLSLFDTDATADLRKLFRPGGQFAIEEIVDLDMVYQHIFDATILPMIIIARASPADPEDTVTIRLANPSCIAIEPEGRPTVDFRNIPTHTVRYADLFAPDGRIYTRMTATRAAIVRKLRAHSTIADVALRFWTFSERNRIQRWSLTAPPTHEQPKWEEKRMLRYGLEQRAAEPRRTKRPAVDVYKGENIVSTAIIGSPTYTRVDPLTFDNPSVWKYLGDAKTPGQPNILGRKAFAIAGIAHTVNAAPFDPQKVAFLNSATIFVPEPALGDFPFDLLFISNIYVFYAPLAARMGILRAQRSHFYPETVAQMPWTDNLRAASQNIEGLRQTIIERSRALMETDTSLDEAIAALGLDTVKTAVRKDDNARLQFSSTFDESERDVEIGPVTMFQSPDGWTVSVNGTLLDTIEVTVESIAQGMAKALERRKGATLNKNDVLNLLIPVSAQQHTAWDEALARHDVARASRDLDAAIEQLDAIVGRCFGLSDAELRELRHDLGSDPFLSKIRPIYPGSQRRLQGLREGLDSSRRYA